MTHDAATIAGINRRIAEFEGWLDIFEGTLGVMQGTPPSCAHRTEGRALVIQDFVTTIPDYWHSADAILPVVERLCRERKVIFEHFVSPFCDGTIAHNSFVAKLQANGGVTMQLQIEDQKSLPAAACLAVVAVLDGTNNERAEP